MVFRDMTQQKLPQIALAPAAYFLNARFRWRGKEYEMDDVTGKAYFLSLQTLYVLMYKNDFILSSFPTMK